MSACPKCGYPAGPQESTCPRCGVIFARIRDGHAAPRPPVAELPETRGRSGSCLLAAAPDQSGVQLAGKALVLLVLAVWGLRLASQPIAGNAVGSSVLHLINLPFHEAGHVFFSPLGRLLQVLGGSLGQLIIPGIVIAAFLRQRQPFSASVGLWWLGESLLDLAPYIDDARAGQLVLLGGVPGSEVEDYHDWEVILTRLGLMQYDHALARCAWVLGTLLILAALSWGGWIMTREYRLRKRPPF